MRQPTYIMRDNMWTFLTWVFTSIYLLTVIFFNESYSDDSQFPSLKFTCPHVAMPLSSPPTKLQAYPQQHNMGLMQISWNNTPLLESILKTVTMKKAAVMHFSLFLIKNMRHILTFFPNSDADCRFTCVRQEKLTPTLQLALIIKKICVEKMF